MAVSYTQTLSTDMIVSEIENLIDWHNNIIRCAFYPSSEKCPPVAEAPSALLVWSGKEVEKKTLDYKLAERLTLVHAELCKVAAKVIAHEGALPLNLYEAFENQFEGYITQIRRLEQDLGDTAGAVDTLTGLRTVAGLRNELRREQDRYDRKGTSFSIASIEIDGVDKLQQEYDRRQMDAVYSGVAQLIARTVRSFDDAYYLGSGEFLVVLKHVEFMDACSVMDRLRKEIETTPLALSGGQQAKVTASFGIVEAQQRENAEQVLEQAKAAKQEAKGAGGNRVVEYRETSALEQYARDMKAK